MEEIKPISLGVAQSGNFLQVIQYHLLSAFETIGLWVEGGRRNVFDVKFRAK